MKVVLWFLALNNKQSVRPGSHQPSRLLLTMILNHDGSYME